VSKAPKSLGLWGEDQAAAFLEEQGYQILGRNIRTKYGELDLVAQHENITVFIEVKTRTSTLFGWPEEAVTSRKQTHLRSAAEAYLVDHPALDREIRIDVIAIERRFGGSPPLITHFIDAIF
jgi:putative endonuclease